MPPHQGRARGLYDEQLQRKQQEKALGLRGSIARRHRPARFPAPALPSRQGGRAGVLTRNAPGRTSSILIQTGSSQKGE